VFVVPQLVLTEAACLIGKLLGPVADASYLRPMAEAPLDCYAIDGKDLLRMAELIDTYADLRIGVVDAAVIAVAERSGRTMLPPSTTDISPLYGPATPRLSRCSPDPSFLCSEQCECGHRPVDAPENDDCLSSRPQEHETARSQTRRPGPGPGPGQAAL